MSSVHPHAASAPSTDRALDAVVYVDTHPELAAVYGREQLLTSIALTLRPLAQDRPWRLRTRRRTPSRVGTLTERLAQLLEPPPGTQPQPRCSAACYATHALDLGETG